MRDTRYDHVVKIYRAKDGERIACILKARKPPRGKWNPEPYFAVTYQAESPFRLYNRRASDVKLTDLSKFVRWVGELLSAQKIEQADAEEVLDHLYAEINRRISKRK